MWELLEEEHYPVKQNEALRIALLYGLFTDTSSFYDLYREKDIQMRMELSGEFPVFEKLTKSCMTVGELMIASDAMYNHFCVYAGAPRLSFQSLRSFRHKRS